MIKTELPTGMVATYRYDALAQSLGCIKTKEHRSLLIGTKEKPLVRISEDQCSFEIKP